MDIDEDNINGEHSEAEDKLPRTKTFDSGVEIRESSMEDSDDSTNSKGMHEQVQQGDNNEICTKKSFVDVLLEKFHKTGEDPSNDGAISPSSSKNDEEDDFLIEIDAPIKYKLCSKNADVLPTPIVENQTFKSVFTNDEEEYNHTIANRNQQRIPEVPNTDDKNVKNLRNQPPYMKPPPQIIENKPKTLAEKRHLVQVMNPNYLRDELETKIYKQIERHRNRQEIHLKLLDDMSDGYVPIKHGPWKVLSWLRTREGKYIQQYFEIDGARYRLSGSKGNHDSKIIKAKYKEFPRKEVMRNLSRNRLKINKATINQLFNTKSIQDFVLEKSAWNLVEHRSLKSLLSKIKPAPLSKKIEYMNKIKSENPDLDEDSLFLGDFLKYRMPDITLEVTKKHAKPVDKTAKNYLGTILPHVSLSEEWCEFALSALEAPESAKKVEVTEEGNKDESDKKRDSFEFKIPYEDENQSIVSREILKRSENVSLIPLLDDNMKWTFEEQVNKDDELEVEIAAVIKGLCTSVAINLNDDLFTKIDLKPHYDESPTKNRNEMTLKPSELSLVKNEKSKKMLRELKKLNANVFEAEAESVRDEALVRQATAHLGKEEKGLRPTVILTESETVLLNEEQTRDVRKKKAPKRFMDYENSDEIFNEEKQDNKESKKQKLQEDKSIEEEKFINSQNLSEEEIKSVKKEILRMINVKCELKCLEDFYSVEPWCMIHRIYKCQCFNNSDFHHYKITDSEHTATLPVKFTEFSRAPETSNILATFDVQNLSDLINGKIGPIFININDAPETRDHLINRIYKYIMQDKMCLVYFNSKAYFINQTRVNISSIDFKRVEEVFDYPIFILRDKKSPPTCVSSAAADKFIKNLFTVPSDIFFEVESEMEVERVGALIEEMLRKIKYNIQKRIGSNPSELVMEQMSRITKDRGRSQSLSSTNSSPSSFFGRKLNDEDPLPLQNSELIHEFNTIFSKRMQNMKSIIDSNSLGIRPSNELVNKLYIYRWSLLLKSFEENLIHVWIANLYSESGKEYQVLVLTDSKVKPKVCHADPKHIVNIKNLKISDSMPELARLILLRWETRETQNNSVLIFGCKGYLRVCGMLNNSEIRVESGTVKANQMTHPRVATKIQKVYKMWVIAKKNRAVKLHETKTDTNPLPSKPPNGLDNYNSKLINNSPLLSLNRATPTTVVKDKSKTGTSLKWFLFNVTNDFSYIYIKPWGKYLPKHIIMKAIIEAKASKKAIGMAAVNRSWPRIFALPSAPLKFKEQNSMSNNFIIFGPYLRDSDSNLLLLRDDDSGVKMQNGFINRTRCLWVFANTLKIIQDAEKSAMVLSWGENPTDCFEL